MHGYSFSPAIHNGKLSSSLKSPSLLLYSLDSTKGWEERKSLVWLVFAKFAEGQAARRLSDGR